MTRHDTPAKDRLEKEQAAYFRRSLRFDCASKAEPFHFRVAAGKEVERVSDTEFRIGRLRLTMIESYPVMVREGDPAELLIVLDPPVGRSALTLEYRW